jgi:hypothetical protein
MILSRLEQDKPGFRFAHFLVPDVRRDRKHRRPRLTGITVTELTFSPWRSALKSRARSPLPDPNAPGPADELRP